MQHKFGRYQILDFLGEGGMGKVYRAYDTQLRRTVALKILIKRKTNDFDLKRFRIESQAMARLNHPNIIQFYEFGESPNHFIAMEYIEGHTLSKLIKEKNVNPSHLVDIMIKLCDGLAYAHKNKIFHRDIKPSNIMILKSGMPKIMDFGLAKMLDSEEDLSQTGDVLGTPVYMSPEQVKGNYSKQSDIYSIGATLYEALTYRCLFQGDPISIMFQISHEDPILPHILNPDISPYLEAICLKCIDKKEYKRYKNFEILSSEFFNFKNNQPIIAKPYKAIDMLKKFAIKYRAVVISLTVIFFTLIISLFVSLQNISYAEKSLRKKLLANQKSQINQIKINLAFAKIQCENSKYKAANKSIDACRNLFIKTPENERFKSIKASFLELEKQAEYLYSYQIYPNLPIEQENIKINEQCITRSPSLNWLAITDSGNLYILNTSTRRKQKIGFKSLGIICAFSKNDLFFAYGDAAGNLSIWDIRNTKILFHKKVKYQIKKLFFSNDSKMLFSQIGNKPVIWDLPKMEKIFELPSDKNFCANFSPDGIFFALGDKPHLEIWNIREHRLIERFESTTQNKSSLCFSPNGKNIAFSAANQLWIYNRKSKIVNNINSKNGAIENFIWNSDQTLFALASKTGQITVFNTQNYQRVNSFRLPTGYHNNFTTLTFLEDKNILNVWTTNHFIRYQFEKNKEHTTMLQAENIENSNRTNPKLFKKVLNYFLSQKQLYDIDTSCTVSPNNQFVFYEIFESAIFLYDNKENQLYFLSLKNKKYQKSKHRRIVFSKDSSLLMISTKTIREIWNTKSKRKVASWQNDHRKRNPQCFYNNDSFVSINRKKNKIEFYLIDNMQKIYRDFKINADDAVPEESIVSIFENTMFFAGTDMKIFHLTNDSQRLEAEHPLQENSFVTANCFLKKNRIALGLNDGTFKIWDWKKNEILHKKKFSEVITNIKYDVKTQLFWIATTNKLHILSSKKSGIEDLSNIFPISIHANYKMRGKAISNNFRNLFFLSASFRFFKLEIGIEPDNH